MAHVQAQVPGPRDVARGMVTAGLENTSAGGCFGVSTAGKRGLCVGHRLVGCSGEVEGDVDSSVSCGGPSLTHHRAASLGDAPVDYGHHGAVPHTNRGRGGGGASVRVSVRVSARVSVRV